MKILSPSFSSLHCKRPLLNLTFDFDLFKYDIIGYIQQIDVKYITHCTLYSRPSLAAHFYLFIFRVNKK